jgi:PiT family inorganic phosphate transporter
MGLIMLILIGVVPTAYALNRAMPDREIPPFLTASTYAAQTLDRVANGSTVADPRASVRAYLRSHRVEPSVAPDTVGSIASLMAGVGQDMARYKELKNVPADQTRNFRNDLYLVGEALRIMEKSGQPMAAFAPADVATLKNYHKHIDRSTKFIPPWVKVAVAIALGLGTMIGWKRIVITVGERIGKDHLTYAQGAAAELTAMATIGAADAFGLPVSTTHVLSSGVAGTMWANQSGLQWGTVRNLLAAWVLTLPVSILLSGSLFWVFSHFGC